MENQPQTAIAPFKNVDDLKVVLAKEYQKQFVNFFGDQKKAMRFLSGVVAAAQRNPKLLECTPTSVINSFLTMAQLELMPSDVSGEAYVIPYNSKNGLMAQFQLGYQGLVTLFYRAGAKKIVAEIVYENDEFSVVNGEITHRPDVFNDERGDAKGAYVIVELGTGGIVSKVMSKKVILEHAQRFSKSYKFADSPWNPLNDPELWMWRKTVLKQAAKLVPKNERLIQAIGEDNRDSIIGDRLEGAKEIIPSLTMGQVLKKDDDASKEEAGEGGGDAAAPEGDADKERGRKAAK